MKTIVIRTKNPRAMYARLLALGVRSKQHEDAPADDAETLAGWNENHFGKVNTPMIRDDVSGDYLFTVLLSDEEHALLPRNDTPNFSVEWDQDETDGEGNPLPWPEVDINVTDPETGEVTGTRKRGVGRIA